MEPVAVCALMRTRLLLGFSGRSGQQSLMSASEGLADVCRGTMESSWSVAISGSADLQNWIKPPARAFYVLIRRK